ncbi:hypothetical protein UVI_02023100 [Ustilaginoidea virens]|uniref:Uncharacterized protein n=1 Tax=Ustilaginoidea virens TaxID=1159556 RepID=A0A1B5L481_USTVR|nr:hypothetical protein UVI_02023100 [Ustilaginoidea virens]
MVVVEVVEVAILAVAVLAVGAAAEPGEHVPHDDGVDDDKGGREGQQRNHGLRVELIGGSGGAGGASGASVVGAVAAFLQQQTDKTTSYQNGKRQTSNVSSAPAAAIEFAEAPPAAPPSTPESPASSQPSSLAPRAPPSFCPSICPSCVAGSADPSPPLPASVLLLLAKDPRPWFPSSASPAPAASFAEEPAVSPARLPSIAACAAKSLEMTPCSKSSLCFSATSASRSSWRNSLPKSAKNNRFRRSLASIGSSSPSRKQYGTSTRRHVGAEYGRSRVPKVSSMASVSATVRGAAGCEACEGCESCENSEALLSVPSSPPLIVPSFCPSKLVDRAVQGASLPSMTSNSSSSSSSSSSSVSPPGLPGDR